MHKPYNPEIPLHQQVKKIDGGQNTFNLLGVPFTLGVVKFEPLIIKNEAYKISLIKHSAVGSEDGQVIIYDKLTFQIEKESGELIGKDILADDIDTFMKGIHDKALEATVNPLATLSS